jgi:hypothetical protein
VKRTHKGPLRDVLAKNMRRLQAAGGLAKPRPSRTGEKCVSVYLSPEKRSELKILAVTTDTTIDALMRRAADLVLAELKPKPAKGPGSKRSGGKGARRRE